jgi:hypothetical protein
VEEVVVAQLKAFDAGHEEAVEGLAEHLPAYRDALRSAGISSDDVEWIVSRVWAGVIEGEISSLDEYQRARLAYAGLRTRVGPRDWRSANAERMLVLTGGMMRFEHEHHQKHGRLAGLVLWEAAA